MTLICKCGEPAKGTELRVFNQRKDGTVTERVYTEARCQKCINAARTPGWHRAERPLSDKFVLECF